MQGDSYLDLQKKVPGRRRGAPWLDYTPALPPEQVAYFGTLCSSILLTCPYRYILFMGGSPGVVSEEPVT